MERLTEAAERIGEVLRERGESICVAEGSCGGLVSASLVAVPGASNFYVAGGVFYTRPAFEEILGKDREALRGPASPCWRRACRGCCGRSTPPRPSK